MLRVWKSGGGGVGGLVLWNTANSGFMVDYVHVGQVPRGLNGAESLFPRKHATPPKMRAHRLAYGDENSGRENGRE